MSDVWKTDFSTAPRDRKFAVANVQHGSVSEAFYTKHTNYKPVDKKGSDDLYLHINDQAFWSDGATHWAEIGDIIPSGGPEWDEADWDEEDWG